MQCNDRNPYLLNIIASVSRLLPSRTLLIIEIIHNRRDFLYIRLQNHSYFVAETFVESIISHWC